MRKRSLGLLILSMSFLLVGCDSQREEVIEYEDVYAVTEYYNAILKTTTHYENYKVNEQTGLVTGYNEYSIYSSNDNKRDRHSYDISYDERGNKIREVIDKGYYGIVTRTYTYNDDNTINTSTYKSSKDNVEVVTLYTYEYDDEGRVHVQTETEQSDEGTVITYTFEYYDDGSVKRKHYQNGDYYTDYDYTYNDDGSINTEIQTTARSTYKIEYEYDENGHESKEKVYKDHSALVTYTHTYKYEVVGKRIKK